MVVEFLMLCIFKSFRDRYSRLCSSSFCGSGPASAATSSTRDPCAMRRPSGPELMCDEACWQIEAHPRRQTIQFAGPLYKVTSGCGAITLGERDGANCAIIISTEKPNT